MKKIKLNNIYVIFLTLFICNCTSTIESRIENNPQIYSALTGQEKKAVSKGLIIRGMSQDAVYISWGKPSGIMEKTLMVKLWKNGVTLHSCQSCIKIFSTMITIIIMAMTTALHFTTQQMLVIFHTPRQLLNLKTIK